MGNLNRAFYTEYINLYPSLWQNNGNIAIKNIIGTTHLWKFADDYDAVKKALRQGKKSTVHHPRHY